MCYCTDIYKDTFETPLSNNTPFCDPIPRNLPQYMIIGGDLEETSLAGGQGFIIGGRSAATSRGDTHGLRDGFARPEIDACRFLAENSQCPALQEVEIYPETHSTSLQQ